MIALGISPGLRSLAYAVVGFYKPDERGDLIDADVVRGTRAPDVMNWDLLLHQSRPQRLILSVVFERNPPAILAVGPPYSKKEPQLHVEAMAKLMLAMASAVKVPTVRFDDKKSLLAAFPSREPLRNMACRYVRAEALEGSTALLVATATAAAGALEYRRQQMVSRETTGG